MNTSGEATLNLLLFSIGGVHFGCDAEQAEAMATYCGEEADDLFWFHEELGFGDRPVVYHAPSIVTIRTGDSRPYRIIIDAMEDIAEISTDDICPFPCLMEPFVLRKGMWGVVEKKGRMILLMDFQRFLRDKCGWGDPACPGG